MKLSKPVAQSLAFAGLIGVMGFSGGAFYGEVRQKDIQGSYEYRRLENITEQQAHLAQEYIECTLDSADCRSVREEYSALGTEAEQITNTPVYVALVTESQAIDSRRPFLVAGIALMAAAFLAGEFAYQRRKGEEYLTKFTGVMGQVIDQCKSINPVLDATIKKLTEFPLSIQPEPNDNKENQKKYFH